MNDDLLRGLDPAATSLSPAELDRSEELLASILAVEVPRAGRRRVRWLLAPAAAVLAVTGVVWSMNLGAPTVVLAPPVTSATSEPVPTPATARPAPASAQPVPTMTCTEFRDAWHAAITSPPGWEFPADLGSSPQVEGVDGDRVLASGIVHGQRIVRDFPDGLTGESSVMLATEATTLFRTLVFDTDRVVFMTYPGGAITPGSGRLYVLDRRGAEPRLLHTEGDDAPSHVGWPVWLAGDTLRWLVSDGGQPQELSVAELDLGPSAATPTFVPLGRGGVILTRTRLLFQASDDERWRAFGRDTLAPVPIPPGLEDVRAVLTQEGDRLVFLAMDSYEGTHSMEAVIRLLDLGAGTVQDVAVLGGTPTAWSVSGDVVLAGMDATYSLIDLRTGNVIQIGDRRSLPAGIMARLHDDRLWVSEVDEDATVSLTIGVVNSAALPDVVPAGC